MMYLFALLFGLGASQPTSRPSSSSAPAAQVNDLTATFRSGQTFITWRETGDDLARYRIYRSATPILQSSDLTPERLVGEVGSQTALNLSASMDLFELHARLRGNPNSKYELPRRIYYKIDEKAGALSPGTGLFVYTAKSNEKAWYAVTAMTNGAENRSINGNILHKSVAEAVAFPDAILQAEENGYRDYVHWTDNIGTKYYPAMGSTPSIPYNFRVFAPAKKASLPLILHMHGHTVQYLKRKTTTFADEKESLFIALDSPAFSGGGRDYPVIVGVPWIPYPPIQAWYGYNENFRTGKPEAEGKVKPYTVERVIWMIDWAKRNYEIDPHRVGLRGASMGSAGTAQIAMLHPDRIAAIHSVTPILGSIGSSRGQTRSSAPSTSPTASLTTAPMRRATASSSMLSLFRVNLAEYIASHPEVDLPYLIFTAGRTDNTVGWANKPEFMKTIAPMHIGAMLYWDLRPHAGPLVGDPPASLKKPPVYWDTESGQPTTPLTSFATNQSYLAFTNLSADDDPGTIDFAKQPDSRPPWDSPGAGDFIGTINGEADWDRASIIDQPARYEIVVKLRPFARQDEATADITPRRLQQFKIKPGQQFTYSVKPIDSEEIMASGNGKADQYGHVTIPKAPLSKAGMRLAILKNSAE